MIIKASLIKAAIEQNAYTVKSVKSQKGHDGPGYLSCTMYKNGKKLGTMHEDTWGGGYIYDFGSDEQAELRKFSVKIFGEYGDDSLTQYLMLEGQIAQRANRGKKTKTVFIEADDNDQIAEYEYSYPISDALVAKIIAESSNLIKIYGSSS